MMHIITKSFKKCNDYNTILLHIIITPGLLQNEVYIIYKFTVTFIFDLNIHMYSCIVSNIVTACIQKVMFND